MTACVALGRSERTMRQRRDDGRNAKNVDCQPVWTCFASVAQVGCCRISGRGVVWVRLCYCRHTCTVVWSASRPRRQIRALAHTFRLLGEPTDYKANFNTPSSPKLHGITQKLGRSHEFYTTPSRPCTTRLTESQEPLINTRATKRLDG